MARCLRFAILERTTAELQKAYQKIKGNLETAADYVRDLLPPPCSRPINIRWLYEPSADLGGDIGGHAQASIASATQARNRKSAAAIGGVIAKALALGVLFVGCGQSRPAS